MENLQDKTCCVIDNGIFVPFALQLSKGFGKVLYFSPWASAFPKSNSRLIGSGFSEIIRINNFFDYIHDIDCFCFPDIYFGDLQNYLVDMGKPVFGSKNGDELEIWRDQSKKHMANAGIEIGIYEVIKGISALREYLKVHENVWIKISCTRGDMETMHSPSYTIIEPRIDMLAWQLGAKKEIMEFIVEDAIEDAIETGVDIYTVDGKYPTKGIVGIEIKDRAYLCHLQETSEISPLIFGVNEKLTDTLSNYKYRNFMSTEIRLTSEKNPYMIDFCARLGSPPSEIYISMFDNLSEIVWEAAHGNCIDPINNSGDYGAQLLIHSQWSQKNWQALDIPEEIKNNIVFRSMTKINNNLYCVPGENEIAEIGAVVAIGNSPQEVIDHCKEIAEQITSYDLQTFPESLDIALSECEKLQSWGIDILESDNG